MRKFPPAPSGVTASRTADHVIGAAVNLVLLALVNGTPGWRAVPFLTEEAAPAAALLTVALWVGVGVHAVLLLAGSPARMRALGDVVSAAFGVAISWELLRTFPVDASAGSALEVTLRGVAVLGLLVAVVAVVDGLTRVVGRPRGTAHVDQHPPPEPVEPDLDEALVEDTRAGADGGLSRMGSR